MGLSYAQAQSLGIGHLHPAKSRDRSAEQELLDRYARPLHVASAVEQDGLNKLERRFRDRVLEPAYVGGRIGRYWREPVKLRLAGRTYYTPDWLVMTSLGEHGLPALFTFIETKGFMRDDASVKLKVAADSYPCFRWLLVTRPSAKDGWLVREVTSSGIGTSTILVPWIHGE